MFRKSQHRLFSKAYTSEAIQLRENAIKIPILVLHPQIGDFNDIFKYDLNQIYTPLRFE